MSDTARDILTHYAPRLRPWSYSEERSWDEPGNGTYYGDRLNALADLIDANDPDPSSYNYAPAIAFRNLVSDAQTDIEERRTRAHYRTWIIDTACDIADELSEGIAGTFDPYDLDDDGSVTERVDSAVPVYYADITRVFEENDLDVDDPEIKALAGDDADLSKLQQVAIYEALNEAVYERLREIAEEREDADDGEEA